VSPTGFSAVIFDFDGTIIDTEWSQFVTVQAEFQRHGVEYDLANFRAGAGRADNRHWSDVLQDMIGRRDDIDEITDRRLKAHHELIDASDLRPGVTELMTAADRSGRTLAVASSSPSSWVEGHLTNRGLLDRFRFVATRDHVPRGKPWPDVFLAAAAGIETDPAQCLAIEDSANGVAAAKAAGMQVVAVPNPVTAGSDFSAADLVLDSLAEFPIDLLGP
jgi:putative hydrolase of the HAD superfamily